ncbi:hypothetical protein BD408DRAFT_448879 [Parasitella parasitica]|nr:hypothetical protein BD408DRAFT_448879 [Parasitella parasitica]
MPSVSYPCQRGCNRTFHASKDRKNHYRRNYQEKVKHRANSQKQDDDARMQEAQSPSLDETDQYEYNPDGYSDIFDGERYKALLEGGCFTNSIDVALALFIDGFAATKLNQSAKM